MDFLFLFKLGFEYFHILCSLSASRFVRVLVFCLAHLLPFQGAVTLPWLVLMGVNLSLLLSLTFTLSQRIWGWLVGLIAAGSAVLKGGSAQVILRGCRSCGWGCTRLYLAVGKRERTASQAGAAPSLFKPFILGTPSPQGYSTLQPACI